MSHDQNGRVGGPRCEECNAPLSADDVSERLCLECQRLERQIGDLRSLHMQYLDSIAGTRDRYED
jgi:hypothetical protein